MSAVQDLVRRWTAEGIKLAPAAEPAEIRATFDALGLTATADVLAFYSSCGGMEEMDKYLLCIWPLSEIVKNSAERRRHGLLFADYLADSWVLPTQGRIRGI